ncbi:MAG: hypothetical protein Udaeo2_20650 [Candidatus Udaeobacter sp.]|nr:MAG: hypothetical protein Udaeo2_20650 [Candidatus Udaeobacter sp.]
MAAREVVARERLVSAAQSEWMLLRLRPNAMATCRNAKVEEIRICGSDALRPGSSEICVAEWL